MEFLKPRTVKARQQTLALLTPCLTPVQDDLGNVPVAMQQDAKVNGALIGLTERVCNSFEISYRSHIDRVIATVFEDIYRREATEILLRCDELLKDEHSELSEARARIHNLPTPQPSSDWTQALCDYIQTHYERPNTLVL